LSDNPFIPADPKSIVVQPLNHGMDQETPPNMLKDGFLWDVRDYFVNPRGLAKRPGWSLFLAGNPATGTNIEPLLDMAPLWKTNGDQAAILLTSSYLFTATAYTAPTPAYWNYTTGYVAVSGATMTGYGTEWANTTSTWIQEGDIVILDADGTPEEAVVSAIVDDYTITLTASPSGTYTVTDVMEYGDGESANSPTLDGGVSGLTAATWAQDVAEFYYGTASWLLTKDGTANDGYVYLEDVGHTATNDMHGLTAGTLYTLHAWGLTDADTPANATLVLEEYYGAAWHDAIAVACTGNEWELLTGSVTLNAGTTAVSLKIQLDGAEADKLFYLDRITLLEGAATDYAIRRVFHPQQKTRLDHTVCDNTLLIADYARPLYSFDGTTLTEYTSALDYIASCVTFFSERVWIGNIIEDGAYYRQRIRWSSATDHTSFAAADYLDLPYTPGALKRLVPLGVFLAAYFEDAVYLGRATNNPDLPYEFFKVETGSIGLVAVRGVTSALNGHFFLGQDDLYYLSNNGIEKLNIPVKAPMLGDKDILYDVYITQDPMNDQIIVGFPGREMWFFNYRTKAWSYSDNIDFTFVANPLLDLNLTWGDISGLMVGSGITDDWDTGMASFGSWGAIAGPSLLRQVYLGSGAYVSYLSDSGTTDLDGTSTIAINPRFFTGDFDFGLPDADKTVTRMTIKLKDIPAADVVFTVLGSADGYDGVTGTTKALGTLTVAAGTREGKVNFRFTGSELRFIVVTATTEFFTVTGITFRVAERGMEYVFTP
jgi:hypothetical protein